MNNIFLEKKTILRPILESSEGIHLTIYLVNRGDSSDLKKQLTESLAEAYEWLHNAQTMEERNKFLQPIYSLIKDPRIFEKMKGNIGIFRTKDSFRILNLPIQVERQCHVATSFHVKPLLRWMQIDRDFLLLGLTRDAAHVYLGSQASYQKIETILYADLYRPSQHSSEASHISKFISQNLQQDEIFYAINEWLDHVTQKSKPKLFIAGDRNLVQSYLKSLNYKNAIKTPIALSFDESSIGDIYSQILTIMKNEAKLTLEQALFEYRLAEDLNAGKKNIFQIAKAAVQGRIKKLIIADGINVFGKIDKKTGGLAIHPFDLDHEDDDLLDDLAQTVLASGGEVVIAPQEEIPKGRPILAILEHHTMNLEQEKENL